MLQIIQYIADGKRSYGLAESRRNIPPIISEEYPVTLNNLSVALGMQSGGLNVNGDDLPLEQIISYIKDNSCTLDGQLMIRRVVTEPLMNIRCGYIGSMVNMHLEACSREGWNPEASALHLYWLQEMGHRVAMKVDQKMAQITDGEMGSINIYNGDQIVLSYREYHLIPASERVLLMKRNLQVMPTFAKSIKALCTNGMVLVDDGRLIRNGMDKLWLANMTLDSVIAGRGDGPESSSRGMAGV